MFSPVPRIKFDSRWLCSLLFASVRLIQQKSNFSANVLAPIAHHGSRVHAARCGHPALYFDVSKSSNMKILFVCTQNKCRSPTAEWMYSRNSEHSVASAGVATDAENPIDRDMLAWADRIFFFERQHRSKIRKFAPDLYGKLKIECLYVPDEYEYKNPQLITLLEYKLVQHLGVPLNRASDL